MSTKNNVIGLEIRVDDKGTPVVTQFSKGVTDKVRQMSDRSVGHVKKLEARFRKGLTSAVDGVGKRLVNLKTLAVGALTGWGLAKLAEGFLWVGSSMDNLQIAMDTITKGRGEEWFTAINDWALKMPINTEKGIKAFTRMRAMGMKPTIEQMTTLVDTTAALGGQADTLAGISRALGQIKTKGKVSAEELMQLAERGVPAYEILKEKLGLTAKQMCNIGNEAVDADKAIAAIMQSLEERFGGQSAKIQEKFSGLWETIKSYWLEYERLVMSSGLMSAIETQLSGIVKKLDEMKASGDLAEYARQVSEAVTGAFETTVKWLKETWGWWDKNRERIGELTETAVDLAAELGKIWVISKAIAGVTALAGFFSGVQVIIKGLTADAALLNKTLKANAAILVFYGAYKATEWAEGITADEEQTRADIVELTARLARQKKLLAEELAKQTPTASGGAPVVAPVVADGAVAAAAAAASAAVQAAADEAARAQIQASIDVATSDRAILSQRLSDWQAFYGELEGMISATAEAEKRHITELNALYTKQADLKRSTAELVQSLTESQMPDRKRYESQKSGLNDQYTEAMRLSGAEQVAALETYKQAVASFARTWQEGVKQNVATFTGEAERVVVSSRAIIEQSVSDIERAGQVQQRSLTELAAEKQRQVQADRVWAQSLQQSAQDTAGEIVYLQDAVATLTNQIDQLQTVLELEAIDNATPVIDQIRGEIDALHALAARPITITTIRRTVFAGSGGGDDGASEGSYASGTDYVPENGRYYLHQGEKIQRRTEVERTSRRADRGARKAAPQPVAVENVHIHVPETAAPQQPEDWRFIVRNFILPELKEAGRG
ncbi:MAG: tape measure protein [Deltaproteobacteria bacterium]|nr:tape measure protein [Deltaproteobacteria bacterium]MBW2673199.1 tape measure protein [Deltaproteobacteria bacterium]